MNPFPDNPRNPTNAEWAAIIDSFPNLANSRAAVQITGAPTQAYNCIRYALGVAGGWVNPPPAQDIFERLFLRYGWVKCPYNQGTVDGWALDGTMTHGSRRPNNVYQSKLGQWFRITHPRDGLRSTNARLLYGFIVVSFRRAGPIQAQELAPIDVEVPTTAPSASGDTIATSEHVAKIDSLDTVLKSAFVNADEFDLKYQAWKQTWFAGDMAVAESSTDRAQGKQWEALVAMGPKILPRIVATLKSADDDFAVEIYNRLQKDPKRKVSPEDIDNFYFLDAQASRIIKLYGTLIDVFDNHVSAWRAHLDNTKSSDDPKDHINHPSFDAIVAMGVDQVAPLVMATYSQDKDGWWHEVLHELVHGVKSDATSFNKLELYEQWKKWFEELGA